jgi:hypothetical protein
MCVHKICVRVLYNFHNQIRNTPRERKKKNQHVNTSICPSIYCDNVHVGFVFSVYLCKM